MAGEALPAAPRTTETLKSEILGADEAAADWWVQLHAAVLYQRWNDAIKAAQALLTSPTTVLVRSPDDPSLYVPATRAFGALLARQPPLAEAYRTATDAQAQALLAEAERTGRLEPLERVLREFPASPVRGKALQLLADGYLDRCEFARAAAAFAQLQATEGATTASKEAAVWACKEASALLAAGDLESAAERIAFIRKTFNGVTLERPRLAIGEFCDRLERELAAHRRPPDAAFSADRLRAAQGWSFDFGTHPFDAAFRRNHPDRLPSYAPACAGGIVYATNGNELRAVEAAGREQWRWEPERPGRYNLESATAWLDQLPPTSLRPAVADRQVLFLRPLQLAEPVLSIGCLERSTGQLLWQRVAWSDEREAVETAPVVFRDRAFVIVSTLRRIRPERTVVSRRAVVCFRVETGECVWRTPLPGARAAAEEELPGSVAAPVLSAAGLFVLEDGGSLYCLEPAGGEIRWTRVLEKYAGGAVVFAPGSGRCAASGDRVCAAPAGSFQVECLDARSGRRLWMQNAGGPPVWLAVRGPQVVAAGREVHVYDLAGGGEVWHGEAGEPPVGSGCFSGELALVPTANALHVYDLKSRRLADRLVWPDNRPLTDLSWSGGELVGLAGDTIRKFGKPGAIVEASAPDRAAVAVLPGASPAPSGPATPEELAAILCPAAQYNPRAESGGSLLSVGRALNDDPSFWVVHDAAARQLRCFEAGNRTRVRWQVPLAGDLRFLEFDRNYVYVSTADRFELRSLNDNGNLLFSKQGKLLTRMAWEEGGLVLAYERSEGGRTEACIAGFDARSRRTFEAPLRDLGLTNVISHAWEGDRVALLGTDGKQGYVCVQAALENNRLKPPDPRSRPPRIYQRMELGSSSSITFGQRLVVPAAGNDAVLAWDLTTGRQAWRAQLNVSGRRGRANWGPLTFLGRTGRYLLWQRASSDPQQDNLIGVLDLQSGERLGTIEAKTAVIYRGRLYSLSGRAVRAHDLRSGQAFRELSYPPRNTHPVWLQPFGDRLVVALADDEGLIRSAVLQDPDLGGSAPRRPDDRTRYTEIFETRDPIYIDGRVDDDWARVQMPWEEIKTWQPARDRRGRAATPTQNANDLSARWRACVDADALYLAVRVNDNRIVTRPGSDCPWIADSIEVAFSAESFPRNLPTFTFALEGPGQCWAAGPRLSPEFACVRYDPLEHELVYELAFPWSSLYKWGILSAQALPEQTTLGFALVVNDHDGAGVKGSLEWGEGLAEQWNPSQWKALRFSLTGRGRR